MEAIAIEAKLRSYIAEQFLDGDEEGLEADTLLLALGIVDSLAMVNLVTHIESEFSIRVAPDELTAPNFRHIEAICELIQRKLGAS